MRLRIILGLLLPLLSFASGSAFHEPGETDCSSCHLPFGEAEDSQANSPNGPNPYMLKAETASDVCLSCHATDNGGVFGNDIANPSPEYGGGNFVYLLEDNLNDTDAGENSGNWIPGDAAGHNIDAPEHGLRTDMTLYAAPGGHFPSDQLECTSCHDPHGNDNFRMLHGIGPIQDGSFSFANAAPHAEGISLNSGGETDGNHTAYRSGMSEWCANCHTDFHNESYPSVMTHPSGMSMGSAVASMYGTYNGSDDPLGGFKGTSYLAQVPFETDNPGHTTTSTDGPTASSKVMCLSCHRAHASSSPDAGRWDFNVTYLAEDGQQSGSHPLPNPFGPAQRSLCNKCHVKDGGGAVRRDDFVISTD